MAVKSSDKSNFCGVGGGGGDDERLTFKRYTSSENNTWHSNVRNNVSYDDADYDDDLPLSERLSRMSNFGTWRRNCDVPIKKRRTTATNPVKRPFDNSNSLQSSVKKSKVTPYDNQVKDKVDTTCSRKFEMPSKSAEKSFSSLKEELAFVEKSFEECKKKRQVEEESLHSIQRDIEECSKDLENMKKEISCVERIYESHKKMQGKIEEFVKDFLVKKAQLSLMDDLIGERKKVLKTKETELRQIMDNIDKVRKRKEWELKAFPQKTAECTLELETKEKLIEAMKKQIDEQAERLESERMKLLRVMQQLSNSDSRAQMKDYESTEKQFGEQVKEIKLKEKRCRERMVELESKEKIFNGRVNKLKLKEKHLEGQVKESKSKVEKFRQMKELDSEKKHVDSRMKDVKLKEMELEGRAKGIKLNEEQLKRQVKEFESEKEKFKSQLKELELEKEKFEGRLKDHLSNKKLLEDQMKEFQSIKEEFDSKEEKFQGQVKELKSEKEQFEGRLKDHLLKEEELNARMLELESKDKEFKVHTKELEPKEKQFDGCVKDLDLREKQYDALIEPSDEEADLEFVENLIMRQQFDEAVRFSRAYNFSDNNQLVDLFEEHVQNLKLISESSCKETNSIEIKDKARCQEVASLIPVIVCIIDNKLGFKDLLNKIHARTLELRRQRGK